MKVIPVENKPIISLNNVSVSYEIPSGKGIFGKSHFTAVENLDLDIKRGESWAIVGESGSGKSTLAMAIIGLLGISHGKINYDFTDAGFGLDPETKGSRKNMMNLWRRSSIVFQDPFSALDGRMLIGDIVVEPFIGHKLGNSNTGKKKAAELFPNVGLKPEYLEYFPDQLSGGLRQRVAIARSLINDPEFIVFDEPTSSLDVSVQAQILNLILDIKDQKNLTYVFITHNLIVARHMSEKIMIMYLGNSMETGKTEEIFKDPAHPYTKLLISSVPLPKPNYEIGKPPILKGSSGKDKHPKGCVFHNRCPVATEYCGWTSEEVIEMIKTELYSITGEEELKYEIMDDITFSISEHNSERYENIFSILLENRELLKYSDLEKQGEKILVKLHENWKPRMVKLKEDRFVKCVLYDKEFSGYREIASRNQS